MFLMMLCIFCRPFAQKLSGRCIERCWNGPSGQSSHKVEYHLLFIDLYLRKVSSYGKNQLVAWTVLADIQVKYFLVPAQRCKIKPVYVHVGGRKLAARLALSHQTLKIMSSHVPARGLVCPQLTSVWNGNSHRCNHLKDSADGWHGYHLQCVPLNSHKPTVVQENLMPPSERLCALDDTLLAHQVTLCSVVSNYLHNCLLGQQGIEVLLAWACLQAAGGDACSTYQRLPHWTQARCARSFLSFSLRLW
mmetsp:Transcript_6154/g.18589  ORF Transcript_6154/g.18589 Transcript_6154/m.18589 type:complete len:248 (-) Transcript_6154:199-942(-)